MEMLSPDTRLLATEPLRPLKRVEYEHLAKSGCYNDERVELLFGVVVEMPPIDSTHNASVFHVRRLLERQLGGRARVHDQSTFSASEHSEPQPDVMVVPDDGNEWSDHPSRAHLIIEVAGTSLALDRGVKARLYAETEVEEYWIVNLQRGEVEVYRDREAGQWRTKTTHGRGECISPRDFSDVVICVSDIVPPV